MPAVRRRLIMRLMGLIGAAGLFFATSIPSAQASCIEAKAVDSMHKIYGQLIIVGFTGRQATDAGVKEALADIGQGYAGGLVFFGRNISSEKQLIALTSRLKRGAEFPPFLAIDEEGGKVERLTPRHGFNRQPGASVIVRHGLKAARKTYDGLANELARAGLNFNLGPVVDLNLQKNNPIIGGLGRSFGSDPDVVVEFAQAFVEAHRRHGIVTALKHFPGHGSSRQDSHETVVDVTGDWRDVELLPYRELITDNLADAVMMTHLINRKRWSLQNLPATLSGDAVVMLRQDLNFDGVILSDDLQMEAIAKDHPLAGAIVQALDAGNDIVLIGNVLEQQPDVARFAVRAIENAVTAGDLNQQRLEQSFCRVIALKKKIIGGSVTVQP